MKYGKWFPVAHHFLHDLETVEMIALFGDRAVFVWMEMLSWGDRNGDGLLKGTLLWWANSLLRIYSKGNQRWLRRDLDRLQNLLRWMSEKHWIRLVRLSESGQTTVRDASETLLTDVREGSETALEIVNFWKFHRRRDAKTGELDSPPPNPPNPTDLKKERERESEGSALSQDFVLTDGMKEEAVKIGVPPSALDAEFDKYKDRSNKSITWKIWSYRYVERERQNGKEEKPPQVSIIDNKYHAGNHFISEKEYRELREKFPDDVPELKLKRGFVG